jgi:hypothetical protein
MSNFDNYDPYEEIFRQLKERPRKCEICGEEIFTCYFIHNFGSHESIYPVCHDCWSKNFDKES